jgi:hypothetical protein
MAKENEKDMAAVIDMLIDKIASMGNGGGITTEQLDKLLEKTAGTTADAFRQALIPENKIHPAISAYSYPEGDQRRPKPRLRIETYFCGHRQREDNLTPEELDGFNALADGQIYEARSGQWTSQVVRNGTKEILLVHCAEAIDRDRARDLPPLLHILTELKDGPQAVDLASLTRQLNEMKARLDAAGATAA